MRAKNNKCKNMVDKLITLYNAVEGENYSLDTEIIINTLKDALYLDRINDLSFTIDGKLVIVLEDQSTINENMPLRFLLYITRIYEKIIDNKSIYKRKLVKIPTPRFIVLYNGREKFPSEKTLRLSDAFLELGIKTELELEVTVLNVNQGYNEEIKTKSKDLEEYITFISRIRENQYDKGMPLEDAMNEAIDYCIENGILCGFLSENGSEVRNMLFTEFNIDDAKEVWQQEAREDGREEKSREIAKNLKNLGMNAEQIAEATGLSVEEIKRL